MKAVLSLFTILIMGLYFAGASFASPETRVNNAYAAQAASTSTPSLGAMRARTSVPIMSRRPSIIAQACKAVGQECPSRQDSECCGTAICSNYVTDDRAKYYCEVCNDC